MLRLLVFLAVVYLLFVFGHFYVFYGAVGDSSRYFRFQVATSKKAYTAEILSGIPTAVKGVVETFASTFGSDIAQSSTLCGVRPDAYLQNGWTSSSECFGAPLLMWLPQLYASLKADQPKLVVLQGGTASTASCLVICKLSPNTAMGTFSCVFGCDGNTTVTLFSVPNSVNSTATSNPVNSTITTTTAAVANSFSIQIASSLGGWADSTNSGSVLWMLPAEAPPTWLALTFELGLWSSSEANEIQMLPLIAVSSTVLSTTTATSETIVARVIVVLDTTTVLRESYRRSSSSSGCTCENVSGVQLPTVVSSNSLSCESEIRPWFFGVADNGSVVVSTTAPTVCTGDDWVPILDGAVSVWSSVATSPSSEVVEVTWTINDLCDDSNNSSGCVMFWFAVVICTLSMVFGLGVLVKLRIGFLNVANACDLVLRPLDSEVISPGDDTTNLLLPPERINENSFTATFAAEPSGSKAVRLSPQQAPLRSPKVGDVAPPIGATPNIGNFRVSVSAPTNPLAPVLTNRSTPPHKLFTNTTMLSLSQQNLAPSKPLKEGPQNGRTVETPVVTDLHTAPPPPARFFRQYLDGFWKSMTLPPDEIATLLHCIESARVLARHLLPFTPDNLLSNPESTTIGKKHAPAEIQPSTLEAASGAVRATNAPSPNPLLAAAISGSSSTLIAIADVRQGTDASSLSSISYSNSEDVGADRPDRTARMAHSSRRHSGSIRKRHSMVRAAADCRLFEKKHVAVVLLNARSFHSIALALVGTGGTSAQQLVASPFGERIPSNGQFGGGRSVGIVRDCVAVGPRGSSSTPVDNEIIRAVALMSSNSYAKEDPGLGSPVTSLATTTVTVSGAGPVVATSAATSSSKHFAQLLADYCDRLTAITKLHRGSMDYINGDHVVVSFNATLDCALPAKAALMWMSHVKDSFRDDGIMGRVECGAALGSCLAGLVGIEGHRRGSVIGPVVTHAAELQRLVRKCPPAVGVFSLVASKIARELQHEFHFALMGSVTLPDSCTAALATSHPTSMMTPATSVMPPATTQSSHHSTIELSTTQSPEAMLAQQSQESLVYAFMPQQSKHGADKSTSRMAGSHRVSLATGAQGEEWLYQVGKNEIRNPFTKANNAMQQVLAGNLMAAEALIAEHKATLSTASDATAARASSKPPTVATKSGVLKESHDDLKRTVAQGSLNGAPSTSFGALPIDDLPLPRGGGEAANRPPGSTSADALWVAIEDAVRRRSHSIFAL